VHILHKLKLVAKEPSRIFMSLGYRHFLNWMPDRLYLKLMFRCIMKQKLDLDNPKTFNEKLQWLKLYDRRPEYTMMVDKYAVKQYVAEKIGEEYIIPTLGVWDSFDDIDFSKLPNQFVLKCTHDSGGLVICRNKDELDIAAAREKLTKCLKRNYYWWCREWPYKNVKPRIIAEKYMEDVKHRENKCLLDYKFYYFNGTPKFLYVSEGLEDHSTAKMNHLYLDWTPTPFQRSDYFQFDILPDKPFGYNEILKIGRELAESIPFARVDFYEIDRQVYFSEITFTPCSGYMPFDPHEWDNTIGSWLKLPERENQAWLK